MPHRPLGDKTDDQCRTTGPASRCPYRGPAVITGVRPTDEAGGGADTRLSSSSSPFMPSIGHGSRPCPKPSARRHRPSAAGHRRPRSQRTPGDPTTQRLRRRLAAPAPGSPPLGLPRACAGENRGEQNKYLPHDAAGFATSVGVRCPSSQIRRLILIDALSHLDCRAAPGRVFFCTPTRGHFCAPIDSAASDAGIARMLRRHPARDRPSAGADCRNARGRPVRRSRLPH